MTSPLATWSGPAGDAPADGAQGGDPAAGDLEVDLPYGYHAPEREVGQSAGPGTRATNVGRLQRGDAGEAAPLPEVGHPPASDNPRRNQAGQPGSDGERSLALGDTPPIVHRFTV